MKLSIKLLALLSVVGFASCSKSELVEPTLSTDGHTVNTDGTIDVTIKAGIVTKSTKVSTDVNRDYSFDFGWEKYDKLAFIPCSGATSETSATLTVCDCTSDVATLTGTVKAGVKNRLIMYPSATEVSPISYNGTTASLDVSYQSWDMKNVNKSYEGFADAVFMINDDGERDEITLENVENVPSVNFAHLNACLTLRINFSNGALGEYAGKYTLKRVIFQNMPVKADINLTKNPDDAGFMTNIQSGAMNIEVRNSPYVAEGSGVANEYWIPVPIFATNSFNSKSYDLSIVLERQDGDQIRTAYQTIEITPSYADLAAGTNNAVNVEITGVKESRIGGMLMINEILSDPNSDSEFVDFNDQDFIELMNVSDQTITWSKGQMRMTAYNDGLYTDIDLESISNGVITDGSDKVAGQTSLKSGYYFVQKCKAGANMIHSTQNFIVISENIATKADGTVDTQNPLWIPIETLALSAMDVDDSHTLRYSFGYKTSVKDYINDPTNGANAWGIPEKGCTYGRANAQIGDNIYINEYALKYDFHNPLIGGDYYDAPEDTNWIELYNSTIDQIELLVVEDRWGDPISGVQIYRRNAGRGQSDDMYTIEDDYNRRVILPSKGYFTMDYNDNYLLSLDFNYGGYWNSGNVGTELILMYGKWQSGTEVGKIRIDSVPIWDLTTYQTMNKDYTYSFARVLQSRNWYVDTNPTKKTANTQDGANIVYTRPTTDVPTYTPPLYKGK